MGMVILLKIVELENKKIKNKVNSFKLFLKVTKKIIDAIIAETNTKRFIILLPK